MRALQKKKKKKNGICPGLQQYNTVASFTFLHKRFLHVPSKIDLFKAENSQWFNHLDIKTPPIGSFNLLYGVSFSMFCFCMALFLLWIIKEGILKNICN